MTDQVKTENKDIKIKVNQEVNYYGTGRRKNSIARVWLVPGSGRIEINKKPAIDYVAGRKTLEIMIYKPLKLSGTEARYDVLARVKGGGICGQAGAIAHGISRALLQLDPDLRKLLKEEKLLTRDPRMKESKKYGRKKARKGPQYRKR
ncbi:MAG: 30S ribosomal protein S9 [Candidatus Margulisbacteria bacterium]|nr:30S ribosomal protein S9 [Candidatus Margulisiibacteriota bacterium]